MESHALLEKFWVESVASKNSRGDARIRLMSRICCKHCSQKKRSVVATLFTKRVRARVTQRLGLVKGSRLVFVCALSTLMSVL